MNVEDERRAYEARLVASQLLCSFAIVDDARYAANEDPRDDDVPHGPEDDVSF